MSYMKGDLLTKTRKLVKGLAKKEPPWLKSMQMAPPTVFPRADGKVKVLSLPEDVYVDKFYLKHPESKYEDPIKLSSFDPVPARIFASRVLELKAQGVSEGEAVAVADMEYKAERKAKKQAYTRLKQVSRALGKKTPPNPYPSAIKEIQAEERPYVRERFFNPMILSMVRKIKDDRAAEMQERFGGQNRFARQERPRGLERFSRQDRFGGPERFPRQDMSGAPERFPRQDRSGAPELFPRQERLGGQGS